MKTILLKIWRELPFSYPVRLYAQRIFTQNYLVGIAGAIFNQKGQILLLKHSYRKEYPWGLPSGWLKRGEQPKQALMREIKEETGLEVRIGSPLIVESDELWPRLDIVFSGVIENGSFVVSSEVLETQFFDVGELPEILPSQARIIEIAARSRMLKDK
ncbi:MAG: NUDIX domain-containing protein [Candidatus Brocadiales bacterium]|nr:NUDIX domain-containing protein [Candidatus Brocadiales bacterium]